MVGRLLADITAAPELDDAAERAVLGAGSGDPEELAEQAEAHAAAAQGGVSMHEGTAEGLVPERLKVSEGELEEPSASEPAVPVAGHDVWSNSGLPAGVAARCDACPDLRTPRRRSLFATDNCVALRTQGWSAPFVKVPPVPLARFAVPAPIREPRSISDESCTVSIMAAGPELAQDPRGPPPS